MFMGCIAETAACWKYVKQEMHWMNGEHSGGGVGSDRLSQNEGENQEICTWNPLACMRASTLAAKNIMILHMAFEMKLYMQKYKKQECI